MINFQTSYDRNQILHSNTKLIGKELLATLNNVDIPDTNNQKTNLQNIGFDFSIPIVPVARIDIEAGTTADGTTPIKLTHAITNTSEKDALVQSANYNTSGIRNFQSFNHKILKSLYKINPSIL